MDILRINDDEVLTDMEAIHRYLTDFFEKWFSGEAADTQGMHAEDVDWMRLLTDRLYYDSFQKKNNIEQ